MFLDKFIDGLHQGILKVSDVLYQPWFVPLLLILGGLYFTIRTRFMQVRLFGESFRVVSEKPKTEGGISSFGAFMVSTASRVGTGNIIGISVAIVTEIFTKIDKFIFGLISII